MEILYQLSGITRQGYFQKVKRKEQEIFTKKRTEELVLQVRKDHPKMGSRSMYYMLQIDAIGINKFEKLVSESGLGIRTKKLWIKTTNSNHNYYKYPNLTNGLKLTGINQLWASDITYWVEEDKTYFIIFILDVYSRYILGYSVSNNMYTINNIKALEMAFKIREKEYFNGLIHHSDKGSQYCSNEYIGLLKQSGIKISMAKNSLENPFAERINGIIKNNYLKYYDTSTLNKLKQSLERVVWLYNNKKPHSELNYLSPKTFESLLVQAPHKQRKEMILYDFNNK